MSQTGIEFSVNEQNALAELCIVMAAIQRKVNFEQMPTQEQIENIALIVEKFSNVNWPGLYDKFHRQGKNK